MILYHGTTKKRAEKIINEKCIKKNIDRFFTVENNGEGYTTQGYIYLSNEITFALSFAISHNMRENSEILYIFKVDIPDKFVEADFDELRHQSATDEEIRRYGGELECSLLEYKACRVAIDIFFDDYLVEYTTVSASSNVYDLIEHAGCNYKYVVENYTTEQRQFLEHIVWNKG